MEQQDIFCLMQDIFFFFFFNFDFFNYASAFYTKNNIVKNADE